MVIIRNCSIFLRENCNKRLIENNFFIVTHDVYLCTFDTQKPRLSEILLFSRIWECNKKCTNWDRSTWFPPRSHSYLEEPFPTTSFKRLTERFRKVSVIRLEFLSIYNSLALICRRSHSFWLFVFRYLKCLPDSK